ncbi:uncharacterized protein LOC117640746 [Thrips palmi]|uniref:Uncharacterized protein LOC117640746 n=1 Tax=Thrips palmi TaxID=161013 RepID=A0A6P8Y1W7_THRPL|nr:uncharacterized protein LOC117640746 [Thrips palmi]
MVGRVAALVLCLGWLLPEGDGQRISAIAGPFRVIPDHFEKCPPHMRPNKTFYKHHYVGWRDRKNPDLWFYSWNGTSYFEVNDDLTVDVNIASWSARGGWKDNAYVFSFQRCCTKARTLAPTLWRRAMVALFDDPSRACPFPPGSYSVHNVSSDIDFDVKAVPAFYYGKWRATGKFSRTSTRELMGCARAFASTVPKLSSSVGPHHIESTD